MHASLKFALTPTSRRRIQAERAFDLAESLWHKPRFRDTPKGRKLWKAKQR